MTPVVLLVLNAGLCVFFGALVLRPSLLGYAKAGKWHLTWLAVGVITLMDEATSIFYAPAEAHRFIGSHAIFFIAATSLIMRVLSTRMVEIAQILELHDIRGGGVYSFSYLVLGPVASFVAVASIMVDYILTACISTVSAVINGTVFLPIGAGTERFLVLGIIWGVAALNILGIRENARVTFGIFIATAVVFLNLIALGVINMDPRSSGVILGSANGRGRRHSERGTPARHLGDHRRRRELRACVLRDRVGPPDGRSGAGLARHLEGVLVPRAHRRDRHAGHLGARALGAHRPRSSTRAT